MGTHLIPRANVKGQDRIFIFFTFSGLLGTVAGIGVGYIFHSILSFLGENTIGLILMAIFAFGSLINITCCRTVWRHGGWPNAQHRDFRGDAIEEPAVQAIGS